MDQIIRKSVDLKVNEKIKIGKNCLIHDTVSIGEPPQHLDYYRKGKRHDGRIIIGNNVVIREFTNVHIPTMRNTIIGDDCFIMSHCHIAHDCVLEEDVIMTTGTHLAGHTYIMRGVGLGLNCCTHQYTTIGSYTMVGMGAIVTKDIPPFTIFNNRYECYKINKTGMQRHGFTATEIAEVEKHYFFNSNISSNRVYVEIDRFYEIRNPTRKVYSVGLKIS